MAKFNLFKISQGDRNNFCEQVIDSSAPKFDFYFMVVLSTLIVALGLVSNNLVLVIGGMLVTPLLSPILAISLGLIIRNAKVLVRSVRIFVLSFILAIIVAYITGLSIHFDIYSIDLIYIMEPNLYAIVLAIVAGLAASFAWVKPNLNNTLPGIAITVTLIPPLTAIGLALAVQDFDVLKDVSLVLILNVLGILIGGTTMLVLMEFYRSKRKILAELKEEEKELQK